METKEDNGKIIVKLSKPVEWEGEKINKVELDLQRITGRTLVEAQKIYKMASGMVFPNFIHDLEYLAYVAQKVSGCDKEFIEKLPAKEYQEIIYSIQSFLIVGE